MRTKTLLMTAAIMAAGLGASVAQTVYSVNSVGYVNVTAKPGYNLFGNPLKGATNNNISTILPAAALPDDTTVLTWNNATQDFDQAVFVSGGAWLDQNFAPATTVLNPGRAFFFQNVKNPASDIQITFVGEVSQGTLTNRVGANYDFVASVVPQSTGLSTIGFPGVQDMTFATFNPLIQDYNQALVYDGGIWVDQSFTPTDPTPAVAQGFLITSPNGQAAQNWVRTFSVN